MRLVGIEQYCTYVLVSLMTDGDENNTSQVIGGNHCCTVHIWMVPVKKRSNDNASLVTGGEKNNSKHVIMGEKNTAHVFDRDRTIPR
jgi:hypothetical protein